MIRYNGPIFLHPPKTAGTSIINALVQSKIAVVDDPFDVKTFPGFDLATHYTFKEFGYPANADYAISVRLPYTRYVSLFYEAVWPHEKKYLDQLTDSDDAIIKFKRYMLNQIYGGGVRTFPCTYWTNSITGKINIIKFENLIEDVNSIYHIDLRSFKRFARRGLGTNYTGTVTEQETIKSILKFYDDATIGIINKIAQSDFTTFGYTKFNNYQEMIDYAQT